MHYLEEKSNNSGEKMSYLKVKISPEKINYFNRILEGYEYLGVVSTLDREQGIVLIRSTPDTIEDVKNVLENLPIDISYLT